TLRRFSLSLSVGRRPAASLGARRLAIIALDFWPGIPLDLLDRTLEDARQPASNFIFPRGMPHADCRLDASVCIVGGLDTLHHKHHRFPLYLPFRHRSAAAAARNLQTKSFSRPAYGPYRRHFADRPHGDLPRSPGMADDRCCSTHARAT